MYRPLRNISSLDQHTSSGDSLDGDIDLALSDADNRQSCVLKFAADVDPDDSIARLPVSRYRRFLYKTADLVIPKNQRAKVHSDLSKFNCWPPPIFMLLISFAQIGVFVYYTVAKGTKTGWIKGCAGCWIDGKPGPLIMAPILREQAWRFITYMFLHAGLENLLANLIAQLTLGIPLEMVHKTWRVAPLYLLGVALGGMLQYIFDPEVYLVGSSGGVYALMIAQLSVVIVNWLEMPHRRIRLLSIILFTMTDWAHALFRRFALGVCNNTSYMAHLGGAITGLLLGLVLLKNMREFRWETILKWVSFGIYALLFAGCVALTVIVQPLGEPLIDISCE